MDDKAKALETALGAQTDKTVRQGRDHASGRRFGQAYGARFLRLAVARPRPRRGRVPARQDLPRCSGPESSGKTTVALHAIAECQKTGGTAAFIDAEHALDPVYAKNLGVRVDGPLASQPDTGEQALEIAEALVRSRRGRRCGRRLGCGARAQGRNRREDGRLATWDFRPALCPRLCESSPAPFPSTNCIAIFINQLRDKDRRYVRQPRN